MAGLPAAYRAARGGCGSSIEHVPGVGFAERERPLGLLAVPLMAVLIVSQGWSTSGGVRCPAFGRTAPRRERPRLRRHGRDAVAKQVKQRHTTAASLTASTDG